jgi:hypothetical protein
MVAILFASAFRDALGNLGDGPDDSFVAEIADVAKSIAKFTE